MGTLSMGAEAAGSEGEETLGLAAVVTSSGTAVSSAWVTESTSFPDPSEGLDTISTHGTTM